MTRTHVGHAIAQALAAHGVDRTYLVPGESFLPVLDGLVDTNIEAIVTRHEGGAAYMAEAHGKATGEPGVAMVTRGPGASNAYVGIHTAWQDATPLVLFVGLIPHADRDRESFQEFDPKAWFGTQTKQVFVIDDASRATRVVAEAFFQAKQGRPGPVVVGLPEDILHADFDGEIHPPITVAQGAVSSIDVKKISEALSNAKRPVIFAGGPQWTSDAGLKVAQWAESNHIPVVHDWRASDRIPFNSPANAGWLGYGRDESVVKLVADADCVLQLGALLTDVPSEGYTLRQDLNLVNIVINLDTSLRGHSGGITHHVLTSPAAFAQELDRLAVGPSSDEQQQWFESAHERHLAFADVGEESTWRPTEDGTAHAEAVFKAINAYAAKDSIYTFGAGNHCLWAQRYLPTNVYPSQLSARNGSMGYSVPAAVAAKLEYPERTIITIAGDGEFGMNGQELGTALQYNAPFLCVVLSNGEFGTIRDHQKKHFPDRVSGTQLVNPDFAEVAKGYGAHGELITSDADADRAIKRALEAVASGVPAVVNVIIDQELSSPASLD